MKGKLRVRVCCETCGYVAINGTKVYMFPSLLDCPKCHTPNSMCAVVELPNSQLAPSCDIKFAMEGLKNV